MTDQTNKNPVVRLATREDEPRLMTLCRALHAENGLFDMDEHATRAMLHRAFDRQGGIIGVIDADNEIAAVVYMLLSKFWYSNDDHLEELFAYVAPRYRKSGGYSQALIAFAKDCSDKIGIPLVIGVLSNKHMEAKVRLYRRELGSPAGAFFVYNSPNWSTQETMAFDPWRSHSRGGGRDWRRKLDREISAHDIVDMDIAQATMTTSPLPLLPLN